MEIGRISSTFICLIYRIRQTKVDLPQFHCKGRAGLFASVYPAKLKGVPRGSGGRTVDTLLMRVRHPGSNAPFGILVSIVDNPAT